MKASIFHSKLSFAYIKYRSKILVNRLLKSIHNLLFKIGIDIRFRKREATFNAIEHNSIDEVNKYYNSTDKQFEITSAEHQRFFQEIIKILTEKEINLKDKNIADFGCGIGNLLSHLYKHFKPASCHGFDFSEILLKLATKRFPEGEFKQHDIYEVPGQKFDFVFCTEVIEHLLYPNKAMKNVLSTVKHQGGIAFISVPDGRKDTFAGHINFWSPESWEVFVRNQVEENTKIETGFLTSNNLYALIYF
jgi:2-polyprenyl-3-methyl-5-hydroxy-6-metoxy-1,4-benzoquinol methylase